MDWEGWRMACARRVPSPALCCPGVVSLSRAGSSDAGEGEGARRPSPRSALADIPAARLWSTGTRAGASGMPGTSSSPGRRPRPEATARGGARRGSATSQCTRCASCAWSSVALVSRKSSTTSSRTVATTSSSGTSRTGRRCAGTATRSRRPRRTGGGGSHFERSVQFCHGLRKGD